MAEEKQYRVSMNRKVSIRDYETIDVFVEVTGDNKVDAIVDAADGVLELLKMLEENGVFSRKVAIPGIHKEVG